MTNSTLPLTKIVFQVLEKSIMNVNYHILDVVTYYYTFMLSFNMPKPRLSIENVLEMSLRLLKDLARNCSKSTIYFQPL